MVEIILAFFGSVCPAIIFNVEKKKLIWAGLSGTVGWLIYSWLMKLTDQAILSTFMGAVAVGIYSEVSARVFKSPAAIFSVSGIFPLVPGILAYETVQLIVADRLSEAAAKGIDTMASAGAIALGIMLISATFRVKKHLK